MLNLEISNVNQATFFTMIADGVGEPIKQYQHLVGQPVTYEPSNDRTIQIAADEVTTINDTFARAFKGVVGDVTLHDLENWDGVSYHRAPNYSIMPVKSEIEIMNTSVHGEAVQWIVFECDADGCIGDMAPTYCATPRQAHAQIVKNYENGVDSWVTLLIFDADRLLKQR